MGNSGIEAAWAARHAQPDEAGAPQFTVTVRLMGLSKTQPYQTPRSPDVAIDNSSQGPDEGARAIVRLLMDRGFLGIEREGA